jgi:hypothetical protein
LIETGLLLEQQLGLAGRQGIILEQAE